MDALEWAVQAAEFGAGELLVTSIDREGTGKGYDLELIRKISDSVTIPVIGCGGAGQVSDVFLAADQGRADAVCLASILHYYYTEHHEDGDDYSDEGNTEYLKSRHGFSKVQGAALPEIKEYLASHGIDCRPAATQGAYA